MKQARLVILLIAVAALGTFALIREAPPKGPLTEEERRFLEHHWQTPVAPQGEAPVGYSPLEASLLPESCGSCHPDQYRDWRTALHSKAMGPGVLGQTLLMEKEEPATARLCWSCHAPLSEQQPLLQTVGEARAEWVENPVFDPRLQRHGVTCAACHVREHRRFGPPRRSSPQVTGRVEEGLPHGGFTAESAFGKSAFCKGCHQFGPDGYALNGKLLENTYREWLESSYAKEGIHCQDCHMPDRRHLWRGIHDPEMTRKGVTIRVERVAAPAAGSVEVVVTVANTGTGHHFPTYLTPRVVILARQLDGEGAVIAETEQQAVIGREVTLDLSEERFDTRIPAGERFVFRYAGARAPAARTLEVQLRVEPDYFYERFFRARLKRGGSGESGELLRQAWENARNSPYLLYERRIPLN